MIVASQKQLGRYKALSKNFAAAISWIEAGAWKSLAPGKYEIDGSNVYASVMDSETKTLASCSYETHRKYTDIQLLVEGKEYVMVRDAAGMPVKTPYNAEKDIEFLLDGSSAPEQRVSLEPGIAAFFFPEDAHKPCVAQDAPMKTKKVVVKVAV